MVSRMNSRLNIVNIAIFAIPVSVIAFMVLLVLIRSVAEAESEVGATAYANLASPDGTPVGTVTMVQGPEGILVQVQAENLTAGGHAFIIHEVGKCTLDFAAAGDHFDPGESRSGFIHPSWRGGEPLGSHGGDLPNIYAAADGTARADFFTEGISLDTDSAHSIFDSDGSAIIIYEKPDAYGEEETDAGERIACGAIYRN